MKKEIKLTLKISSFIFIVAIIILVAINVGLFYHWQKPDVGKQADKALSSLKTEDSQIKENEAEKEDSNIETIRLYYSRLSVQELEQAYEMYEIKKVTFAEFTNWYQDTLSATPHDFEKLQDNQYQFLVDLEEENKPIETYRVVMEVKGDKINTLSSEKIAVSETEKATQEEPKIIYKTTWQIDSPKIYGNNLVWIEYPQGRTYEIAEEFKLLFKKLDSEEIIQLSRSNDRIRNYSISANYIVWEEKEGIFYYQIKTQEKKQISSLAKKDITEPSLYDNKIVYWEKVNWLEYPSGKGYSHHVGDIYLYNLDTGQETKLTYNGYNYEPKIYDNIVAWFNDEDVYYKNLETGKVAQVTNDDKYRGELMVSENYIAWNNYNTNWQKVYHYGTIQGLEYYDLKTKKTAKVPLLETQENKYQAMPLLDDDYLLYSGGISGPHGLFIYDIKGNKTTKIEEHGGLFASRGKIIWLQATFNPTETSIYFYRYRDSAD